MRMVHTLLLATLLTGGCSREATLPVASSEPKVSRIYRHESITVIVSVSETNITTSGQVQLALDVQAPRNIAVVFPEIGDFIKPFSVADGYAEPVQTLPNGKHLHRRVWTLIPSLPGRTVFESFEVHAGMVTVKTEPINLQVTSVLPRGLDIYEIKDIADPISLLPEEREKQQRWLALLSATIAVVLVTLVIKRLFRPAITPALTPDEAARLALADLPEDKLARTQALTEILLAFIEGRFHLPTSGKTILEIIPSLSTEPMLAQRPELETLLTTGEHFRFSNKLPAGFPAELEDYVRSFIEEMKEAPCD